MLNSSDIYFQHLGAGDINQYRLANDNDHM